MAMALHSRRMAVEVDTIHATGGAAANRQIQQVMADEAAPLHEGAEVAFFPPVTGG